MEIYIYGLIAAGYLILAFVSRDGAKIGTRKMAEYLYRKGKGLGRIAKRRGTYREGGVRRDLALLYPFGQTKREEERFYTERIRIVLMILLAGDILAIASYAAAGRSLLMTEQGELIRDQVGGEDRVTELEASVQAKNAHASIFLERSFADIGIKGRTSKGNILTKKPVHRIAMKSQGHSTLGGRKVWFDPDVNRLNYDEHGRLLGEFNDKDQILVMLPNNEYYVSNFDANNHYESNIVRMEKYDPGKVWTAVLFDADNKGYPYIKRFLLDAKKTKQNYLGENPASKLVFVTDQPNPVVRVTYGGKDEFRGTEDIDAEQFVIVKSVKAHGKRLTAFEFESIELLEPEVPSSPDEETTDAADNETPAAPAEPEEEINLDPDAGKSQQQIIDEMTGQLRLFPDE